MTDEDQKRPLGIIDYPLAEKRPDWVKTANGKSLDDLTLAAVESGDVKLADLRITAQALLDQAQIADDAGRPTLGSNFRRAAELIDVPQDVVLEVYELLRPGRARDKMALLSAAATLRTAYGASRMADFVEEAAEVYERRGLFSYRF
jgi:propanediol dehydratase small subunit